MQVRSHWLLSAMLAFTLGVFARGAAAQVFEVSAGASTTYGAEGASVVIHGQNTQTTLGAGLVGGHFAAGGSSIRAIPGGAMTVGQQLHRMDVPTDVFDTSHIFYGVGAGIKLGHERGSTLDAFAGLSSQEGGTPLFATATLRDPAAYLQWVHPFTYGCSAVSTVLLARQKSALESVECGERGTVQYAATLGVGAGAPYAAASVVIKKERLELHAAYIYAGKNFQRGNDLIEPTPEPVRENLTANYQLTPNVNLNAAHQHYLILPTPDTTGFEPDQGPVKSSLDTLGVQYHRLRWQTGVTLIHSTSEVTGAPLVNASSGSNSALTAVVRKSFGTWDLTESVLHSFGANGGASTLLINSLGVNVNPHLRLTENVNVTGSGVTFSHGGALLTTYSSFEVDYQTFYIATDPRNPFKQAMTFDARVRLPRNLALHAGSFIGPTGLTEYTVELARSFDRDAVIPDTTIQDGLGMNTLSGQVVDPEGQPVEGAVVMVGSERLYSDAKGVFFFRERRPHKYPFKVLPEEFLTDCRYVVRSAPVEVQTAPGTVMLHVVVARGVQPVVVANIVTAPDNLAPAPNSSSKDAKSATVETEFGPYRPYNPTANPTISSNETHP